MQNYIEESQIPLPDNWSVCLLDEGRKIFVDHVNKVTTWTDPRDSLTKPQTFADCIGDELPYGWEVAHDPSIGQYFIDHNSGVNQMEDPRSQWRCVQESMIQYYLKSAKESVEAKEKILQFKQERATLANHELSHLMSIFQKINDKNQRDPLSSPCTSNFGSKNSLAAASSSCSLYSKYDPDLLRVEIDVAKQRLKKLRSEEASAKRELLQKQKGVQTLNRLKTSMIKRETEYSSSEKDLLESKLVDLKKLLSSIEEEKSTLINQVAELWRDLQGDCQKSDGQLDCPLDKASCSSQTDIIEPAHTGNRIAALARARLRYNELKCLLYTSHQQLAALNEKMLPADLELNHDQISLIHEKEQLLRELKTVCYDNVNVQSQQYSENVDDPRYRLTEKMHELEEDLRLALRLSREEMSERSLVLRKKEDLENKIYEAGLSLANLEQQLKSLSASTLSTSSLSTNSTSCGSLSPFGGAETTNLYNYNNKNYNRPISNMYEDIRKRVEQLVGPALATYTHPAVNVALSSRDSMIHRENSVGSSDPSNRSMSAAVSDESVAGDSGVFEAGCALKRPVVQSLNPCNAANNAQLSPSVAQIMVTLNFDSKINRLYVTLEKARNFSFLFDHDVPKSRPSSDCLSCDNQSGSLKIRGSLLPCSPADDYTFVTDWIKIPTSILNDSVDRLTLKQVFEFNITLRSVCSKILQLYVFGQVTADTIDCLGEAQLNLAEFNCQMIRSQWVNILGRQFLAIPSTPELNYKADIIGEKHNSTMDVQALNWKNCQSIPARRLNTLKEESSDESTVIPSQTSTLTRNIDSLIEEPVFECNMLGRKTPTISAEVCAKSFSCLRLTINDSDSSDTDEENTSGDLSMREKQTNTDFSQPCCSSSVNEKLPNRINLSSKDGNFSAVKTKNMRTNSSSNVRKLNRSGSDSNVTLHKKEPFKRNIIERRSLRWRKTQSNFNCCRRLSVQSNVVECTRQSSPSSCEHYRTSIDLNIDLETARLRLERKKEDVNALLLMKEQLNQQRKSDLLDQSIFFPSHLADQNVISRVIRNSEKLRNISSVICNDDENYGLFVRPRRDLSKERRARHFVRKAARQVQKLNENRLQRPSIANFCSKISSLVNTSETGVNVINLFDNACEDGDH